MAVIAVGGFQHETNTFAPSKADYAAFEDGGGWPELTFGDAIAPRLAGANIPATGALDALHAAGHRTVGLVWGAASPSAHVTRDAYERIVGDMLARLQKRVRSTASISTCTARWSPSTSTTAKANCWRACAKAVGRRVPVVASLDLHANMTRAMIEHSDGLNAYCTYPHIDMAATGARAARLLDRTLAAGAPMAKAMRPLDFLTGLPSQCTFIEPGKSLYELLARLGSEHDVVAVVHAGLSDGGFSRMRDGRVRLRPRRAERACGRRCARERRARCRTRLRDGSLRAGRRRRARDAARRTRRAGGDGGHAGQSGRRRQRRHDGPAGRDAQARSARRRAGTADRRRVGRQAHVVGIGHAAEFRLGEISGVPGHVPLAGEFTVEALGDGKFTCTGPMFKGFRMDLGSMAVLRRGNVRVVLASKKCQAADQEMFRHVGIEPKQQRMLALKSSVHFRADFQPIAKEVLVVVAPGPAKADPTMFHWTRLRPGLRLKPGGPAFQPANNPCRAATSSR